MQIYIANEHAAKILKAFCTLVAVKGFHVNLIKQFTVYTRISIKIKNNNGIANK